METVVNLDAVRQAKAAHVAPPPAKAAADPFDALAAQVEKLAGFMIQLGKTVVEIEAATARNTAAINAIAAELARR